ncbi:MAG TPA: putative quinol monooxygenase [Gammaproteobacteria bacterium]|nr:putative quinol monooxygenase [Gammaproteobacteria bacterium]
MRATFAAALFAGLLSGLVHAQTPPSAPAGAAPFAVAYVETRADARAAARAALAAYRDAARSQNGSIELFEQVDRPGHFAVLERWRDQTAFDARDGAARQTLDRALAPLRVSGYDERPYKALSIAPETAGDERRSVFVISHVDVAPDPRVAPMLARLAEAGRKEPGNLRFDVVQHAMRANHFTVIEHWRTRAALDAHVAAEATRRYRDELQPLTGSPLDERIYEAVD